MTIAGPSISEDDFSTTILWALDSREMKVVLVEGEYDYAVFSKMINSVLFFDGNRTENNKSAVIKCAQLLRGDNSKVTKFIGIVDADFDRIADQPEPSLPPHVLYTDAHDLDLLIFCSEALESYLRYDFIESWKLSVVDIRETCLRLAKEYGLFKLFLHHSKVSSKKMSPIEQYVNPHDLSLRDVDILEDVKASMASRGGLNEIYNVILDKESYIPDSLRMDIPNGHDAIRIFTWLALKKRMGLRKKNLVGADNKKDGQEFDDLVKDVESDLKKCYDSEFFKQTHLYSEIRRIEDSTSIRFLTI
ncbi:MAG: DUF4435 domain-containing protein [Candidatus Lokiarchaeota archaeon]|nr:DUF4435 domain-containing protein [Candidatus Lokiarchaeota archaeon]